MAYVPFRPAQFITWCVEWYNVRPIQIDGAPIPFDQTGCDYMEFGTAHRPFPTTQTHMESIIQVRRIVTGHSPGVPDHTPVRCAIGCGHCPPKNWLPGWGAKDLFSTSAAPAAISIALRLLWPEDQPQAVAQDQGQQNPVGQLHTKKPPIWYTSRAASQATRHWAITTATVFHLEPSSRRMVATAATQGV